MSTTAHVVPHALSAQALAEALRVPDLTQPANGPHALQTLVADATNALTDAWGCTANLVRLPAIVAVADNYELLGYSRTAVTRDSRYTRYVDADRMLRSHTSAAIPGALRSISTTPSADRLDDQIVAVPGMCYRRDSIDRLHTGTPHQLDIWRILRGPEMQPADLRQMVCLLVEALLPGRDWRLTSSPHPYTLGGQQVDVRDPGRDVAWVEIAECGLADPALLHRCGLGPDWSGLAIGLGLDRLLMLRKGIPDIRLLRSGDPRVACQMLDLEPYRPVSTMPPIARDLSVAVYPGRDEETIGDTVREALGADSDVLESVTVLSRTEYDALPGAARERLGIRPGQVNVLLRMVLRALGKTMTDSDANVLRDLIYDAVHEGDAPLAGS
jgi:phenylalanyl-tRNA synthetase alpha chain